MKKEYRCKGCRTEITFRQRSGYCRDCRKRFCNHCEAPLPEGRGQARCYDCDRAQREKWLAQDEKQCAGCSTRLEADARSRWCSDCRKFYRDYQLRALRANPDRRCYRCQAPLKRGQWSNYCLDCQKRRRFELTLPAVRTRAGLPPRQCGDCASFLPKGYVQRYCKSCKRDFNRMYWVTNGERYRKQWREERQNRRQEGAAGRESASGPGGGD